MMMTPQWSRALQELSDRDESEGEDNDPSSGPDEDREAASTEREAAASDPVLVAALAGIDAHNDFMFKVTHGVNSQDVEDEANRGLSAPEILARSALAGAQLGDQKAAKFAARLESFSSSRDRAAVGVSKTSLGGGGESTKPPERSPKHDAVKRTLNQLPTTPWVGSSAARLVQASASAVANLCYLEVLAPQLKPWRWTSTQTTMQLRAAKVMIL